MMIENMLEYSKKRSAITFALNELKYIIGDMKISRDKGSPTFSVLVNAILQDFDIFYENGNDTVFYYESRDKKGNVNKIKLKSKYKKEGE